MQEIPTQLPQFKHQRTLLLASDGNSLNIYFAHKGLLKKIHEVLSEKHLIHTHKNRDIHNNKEAPIQILHSAKDDIRNIQDKIDALYIFSPEDTRSVIHNSLDRALQKKILRSYSDGYNKRSPLALIRIIAKRER